MAVKKTAALSALAGVCLAWSLGAAEIQNGLIGLSLRENTGGFRFFGLARDESFEPLFRGESRFSVQVNGQVYPLGGDEFKAFRPETASSSELCFQSGATGVLVTETISFIRTSGASDVNGLRLRLTLTNQGSKAAKVGLRCLMDTYLGEPKPPHFSLFNNGRGRPVDGETLVRDGEADWWVSGDERLAVMGNAAIEAPRKGAPPDTGKPAVPAVFFGSKSRLSDTLWKTSYLQSRLFGVFPHSLDDSAVAYYFEGEPLAPGETRVCVILLALADKAGFENLIPTAFMSGILSAFMSKQDWKVIDALYDQEVISLMDELVTLLDEQQATPSLTDAEIDLLETLLLRLGNRYSLPGK